MNEAHSNSSPELARKFLYLYLGLAYADGALATSEKDLILKMMSYFKQYPNAKAEEAIEEVMAEMEKQSTDERINSVFTYCSEMNLTESEVDEVLTNMEQIIDVDGIIKRQEIELFRKVQTYLRSSSLS